MYTMPEVYVRNGSNVTQSSQVIYHDHDVSGIGLIMQMLQNF